MREDVPPDSKRTERRCKVRYFPHPALNNHRINEECFEEVVEKNKSDISGVRFTRMTLNLRDHTSESEPTENIEIASRWLFMTIKWAKSLPYFAELYYPDQLMLLRQHWSKLFLFNLMYFEMLPRAVEDTNDGSIGKGFQEMLYRWSRINAKPDIPGKFDYSMEKIRRLQMDETETLLIKSLLIFNPDTEGLVDASQVQVTQNKCHRALEEHALSANPGQRDRSGRILLTILTLSTFEERDIESIFLSTVLGNATVTSLMENLLCADAMQIS